MISPALVFRSQFNRCFRARLRRGLSLVELMAATVISLIVMGATVQLFGTVGNQISNGRSNIELGDRFRTAAQRLRQDLRNHTADTLTWNRPEDASGYFEIVKGPVATWEMTWSPTKNSTTPGGTLTGYAPFVPGYAPNPNAGSTLIFGDMLFFTTRSRDQPFVGRVQNASLQNTTVESQVAEVAWYLYPTNVGTSKNPVPTIPPTFTLYRRQLLVLPGLATSSPNAMATGTPPSIKAAQYFDQASNYAVPLCDISAHPDGSTTPNMILNSLADLSYRENRFGHFFAPNGTGSFPFLTTTNPQVFTPFPSTNQRYGEDVVLSNVLSFDIKVWDPWAQVLQDTNKNPLVPSDPGYGLQTSTPIGSGVYGAYVDLNWGSGLQAHTSNPSSVPRAFFVGGSYGLGGTKSYLAATATGTTASTYDTWSAGYESWLPSGAAVQPLSPNQSNNGFDNDGANGVNDPGERITCPPYPVPLRGIQIKIRTYEFTSKQVREVTIQESFVPD